jgi:DNA-binding transcriptional MerR regulator
MLIGELSKSCECPAETIRYYEKIGLLPPTRRRANGYRTYDDLHETYLRFIIRAKRLGFTQDEIRQLTNLARQRETACAEVFAILERQHDQVRQRISQLKKIESALRRLKVQCCKGTLPDCPVLEELMH